jgi:ATP-dependent helicase IRC3
MIGEKWLSDVIFTTVKSHADISKVKKGANGDFHPGDLSKAVNTAVTNDLTVRSWLARAMERRSTLVFCVDLAHVSGLTETFRKHGIEARYVTGETPKKLRSERLDAFRNHEFPVLVNCGVFTEGTDIPNIDCVLLARPTRSRNLLVQMIGRGMRLYPRKANCHIIDMVASLETGIVTTPTLFGLDPAELMVAASMADIQKIKDEKVIEMKKITSPRKEAEATPSLEARGGSRVTFTDYDSVFDLLNDSSGDAHIRALSPLAWVEVGGHRYILSTQGGDYITLDKERDDFYVVRETRKLFAVSKNAAPYMPPRELATAITFQDAVHAADTYAQEAYPWRIVSKDQDWRRKPASENQLKFLNKLRDKHNPLAETDITKGKAADMITKIKHGARGRFSKLSVEKRKVVRRVERAGQMEALKEREQVKVGPVAD